MNRNNETNRQVIDNLNSKYFRQIIERFIGTPSSGERTGEGGRAESHPANQEKSKEHSEPKEVRFQDHSPEGTYNATSVRLKSTKKMMKVLEQHFDDCGDNTDFIEFVDQIPDGLFTD